jgi:uncharacterized protein (DUF433 family)
MASDADTILAPGISSNPYRQGGRPTISGTRITVEIILDKLAGGQTIEDILADYPHLTREQILNAIAYAARLVHSQSPADAHVNATREVSE